MPPSTISPKSFGPTVKPPPGVTFYVALVIFFFCYGGACFLYAANRVYRAFKKKRKKVSLLSNHGRVDALPGSESKQVKTVNVYRSQGPSASSAVQSSEPPARQPRTPQPRRREPVNNAGEPPPPPYVAMPGEKPKPLRSLSPASISLQAKSNRSSTNSLYGLKDPPPPYDDEKDPKVIAMRKAAERAMLLEKAVREARERRRREGNNMESRISNYNAAFAEDTRKKKKKSRKKDLETTESLLEESGNPYVRSIEDIVRAKKLAREYNKNKRGVITT